MFKDAKRANNLSLNGFLLYSPDGKKVEKVTLRDLALFLNKKGANTVVQESQEQWCTTNDRLYFDYKVKFSYLSNGERVYIRKSYNVPSIITVIKYMDDERIKHTPIFLATKPEGVMWEINNEVKVTNGIRKHGDRIWLYSALPFYIDRYLDVVEDERSISEFSPQKIFPSLEDGIDAILDAADVKPVKLYSGQYDKDGIAFFAGAKDLNDISKAPFIITNEGEIVKGGVG